MRPNPKRNYALTRIVTRDKARCIGLSQFAARIRPARSTEMRATSFFEKWEKKKQERKISFFGKHLVEKSIRTRVKSAFDKRKPSASRTVCTVTAARRKKEYLRTNRQLRAAPREQLRYVVIISIWSCQCHRVVPRSERVDLKRRSKIAKNRDEKMIRAKSNRVEFPPYEADGRFVEDDTRTTDTRAPTHASTCHVGNDALPFDPRDRNIFSPPLVFARDNATTRFDRVRFYTGQSHPLFASAAEKSIDAMDFATRSFPTSSSSFARSLSVTGHSYAIIFRGCSAPRPVCTLCRRWNVVPLLERRGGNELRAIHASVTFYIARSSLQ